MAMENPDVPPGSPHLTDDLEGDAPNVSPDEALSDAAPPDAAIRKDTCDEEGEGLRVEDPASKFSTLKVLDVTLVVACPYLRC